MAEVLEAQAASLRRHAVAVATDGQAELPLADDSDGWHEWSGGDGEPAAAVGKHVEIQLRDGRLSKGPADAWEWAHVANGEEPEGDIVQWRLSAKQPADE